MISDKDGGKSGREIQQGSFKGHKVAYFARRVVVRLAHSEDETAAAETVKSLVSQVEGARVLRGPSHTGRMVVLLPPKESVTECAARLSKQPGVAYAEPDMVDRQQLVPNDPQYPNQWGPQKVNAEGAWDLQTGNDKVVIGIIDSGISMTAGALDHDDLSTAGRFTLGTDFVDGGTPRDLNGHGTHVVGIAAALGDNGTGVAGMNWGSPVYICRTFDASGNGSSADFADALEEITDFAVANGQKAVINYSGGGADNQTKKDAANYASNHGMLLCAATGNDNGGPVIFPAAYSTTITGVIAVGSTDSNDTVSGFSNVGPEVTVVAPGSSILSTTPTYAVALTPAPANLGIDYGTLSGTSMATPMVTGLCALMWSRHPSHTNQKVKQCLIDTAVKLGTGTFNNSWGNGRIDAKAALKCGDFVLPSKLVLCKSIVILCKSQLVVCQKSQLIPCPTKSVLVVCGKISILTACPVKSVLTCPSFLNCPSAVDGCPSAPGGCEWWDPREEILDPRVKLAGLEHRIQELKKELWYGAKGAEMTKADDSGWFILDDGGEIHGL